MTSTPAAPRTVASAAPSELAALRALAALQARLDAAVRAEDVAAAGVAFAREALGAEGAAIQAIDAAGARRQLGAAELPEPLLAALDGSLTWPLGAGDRQIDAPVVLAPADLATVAPEAPLGPLLEAMGIAALLVAPLGGAEARRGLLIACWRAPWALTEADALLLRVASGQLAAALERLSGRPDRPAADTAADTAPERGPGAAVDAAQAIGPDAPADLAPPAGGTTMHDLEDVLARELAARRRAERAAERAARLQLVTEALTRALTVVDVARVIVERGLPGAGAAAGAVALLDEHGVRLSMAAAVGYPRELVDELGQMPLGRTTPLAVAVRSGRPVWREAGQPGAELYADFTRRAPAYPSGAALPLVVEGRVIGGLGLSFHEPRTFDEDDRSFLLTLAGQCAQAIHRARLYQNERAAREQLDAILGGVADGVLVQRADGSFVYANAAAARMAGFESPAAYLQAETFEVSRRLAVLDAAGHPFSYEQLPARRALRGEPAPEMVLQFRRADTNERRWSRTQARTITGVDGERLAISIFHDITDEVRSGERLRFLAESGAELAGSLDVAATLDGLVRIASTTLADWAVVLLIDADGAVQHIASSHRDPTKAALAQELHTRQLRHASGAALLWQAIQARETLLVPEVTDEMIVRSARDPEHLALLRALGLTSLLYAPLVGRERVLGAIALFMADSGRRFGEEDRAIAVEMARRVSLTLENARLYQETRDAVRARDEFLSIASHELRTPVTAISGVAQVALRARQRGTLDDARLGRALEQIVRSSQRLVTLTEDLLDVSRLQTGRFELRVEPLDVASFVVELADRFRAGLGERHQLDVAVPDVALPVRADPARLEQVLANLLTNAVKYTPDGGRIVLAAQPDGDGVRIAVHDPGIGVPAGAAEAIFQPFGRAPNASHRQIQGLGLGLYICRQIVERHGGRIWAESPGDGLGTTMELWLPGGC